MAEPVFVGVDTGASKTRIEGIGADVDFPTPLEYPAYLRTLCGALDRAPTIERLVVALPTVVEGRKILKPPNLGDGWDTADLVGDLCRARPATDIVVVQDTAAAGYGVMHSADAPTELPALLITLSSGVGGALLWDGGVRPLEVGHMMLDLTGDKAECKCKQIGCVEADLSGSVIDRQRETMPADAPFDWVNYGVRLGRFFGAMAPMFLAREILLMGGVCNHASEFLPSCEEWVKRHFERVVPSIRKISEPDRIGAIGALMWARDRASSSAGPCRQDD